MASAPFAVSGLGVLQHPRLDRTRDNALRDANATLRKHNLAAIAVGGRGDHARAIADTARQAAADLVIVGNRGRGIAQRLLRGSVSDTVARTAACDVLIVR